MNELGVYDMWSNSVTVISRIEVAGILKQMRIENIKHKFEAEEQAAHQHFKVSNCYSLSGVISVFNKNKTLFPKAKTKF